MHLELPDYVQVEPVGQCNLKCEMCAIQYRQDGPPYGPPAYMSFDLFKKIVDEHVNMRDIHLQGCPLSDDGALVPFDFRLGHCMTACMAS